MRKVKKFIQNNQNLILIIFILGFTILKISQVDFKFSDENIYLYMGKALLEGNLPYHDFFFASPPLQILVISFSLLFFGEKIILLKILPIIFCITTSIFLFTILKKKMNSQIGLIASILYLFSFVVLTTSDHFTGIHLTTLLLVISYYFIEDEKYLIAGIFSGLACLTRLYAAFAITGILIYLLIKNRKAVLDFILGGAIIFIPINLSLLLIFKENFISSVFSYHLLKTPGLSKINIFKFFIKWDFILILLTSIGLFIKKKQKILLPLIIIGTTLIFYITYADIYYLYFGLIMPFLAIVSSLSLYKLSQRIDIKKPIILVIIFLIVLSTFNSFFYVKNHGTTSEIDFLPEISEYVKNHSSENDTIYGSFEITPLVALKSNRKITNNYIDTNEKTFLTGMYNIDNRTKQIKNKTKFVIMKTTITSRGKIVKMENIINKNFLKKDCNISKVYTIKKDYDDNAVILFDCE